jgi:hypothetical protein
MTRMSLKIGNNARDILSDYKHFYIRSTSTTTTIDSQDMDRTSATTTTDSEDIGLKFNKKVITRIDND